jgi:hypothetical protein
MVHAVEPALNAFAITFESRITPSAAHPCPGRIHRRTDTSAGVSAAVHEGQWSAGEVPPLARRPTIMAVGREGVSVAAPKKYPNLFTAGRGSGLQP